MNEIEQRIVLLAIGGSYVLLLLLGLVFYFYPPKKINGLYGYRTPRSMKNLENWHFANKLSARLMLRYTAVGLLLFLLSFWLLKDRVSVDALILGNMGLLCLAIILVIPVVESRLGKFEKQQTGRA